MLTAVRDRRSGPLPCTPEGYYTALRPLTGAAKYAWGAHEDVDAKIEEEFRLRVAHVKVPQGPINNPRMATEHRRTSGASEATKTVSPSRESFGEISSLLTVKTLTGMTTDVYPRENYIVSLLCTHLSIPSTSRRL